MVFVFPHSYVYVCLASWVLCPTYSPSIMRMSRVIAILDQESPGKPCWAEDREEGKLWLKYLFLTKIKTTTHLLGSQWGCDTCSGLKEASPDLRMALAGVVSFLMKQLQFVLDRLNNNNNIFRSLFFRWWYITHPPFFLPFHDQWWNTVPGFNTRYQYVATNSLRLS